ncbi:hypothetical protein NHX12_012929 [Muraenolepis orangiensis]|uniref:RRM domain-containing protein n=1 Tax=Muraenolepis orangiensis TaxID=630683 RepID=A0A9Q0DH41_9TELE|nr:hypothetical protein NHX12_012929 [Muraenolepis orangiensis]
MPRVYIGRLGYQVREKDLHRFFSRYGKLLEIDLKNGFGFVEFECTRDADDAVHEMNGRALCGERVVVEHARGPRRDRDSYGYGGRSGNTSRSFFGREKYGPPVRTDYRLIVQNLSRCCSWQDLKDLMRQAGEVSYADAHKDRTNEGVVEFACRSDMKRAMDTLDGKNINGRKIRLVEDRPRRRRRSHSGSRSRSRSRRRPRSWSQRSSSSPSRSRSRSRSNKRSRRSPPRPGRKSRSRGRKSPLRSRHRRSRSPSGGSRRSPSPEGDARCLASRSKSRSLSRSVSQD